MNFKKLLILSLVTLFTETSCSLLTGNTKQPLQSNVVDPNTQTPLEKIAETLTKKITTPNARFNNGYGLNCRIIDPNTGFIIAAEEAFYAGE